MPKITVIVPVYKVERYLSRCLDSIIEQSFSDFDAIMIDDGSPDQSSVICDQYVKKDARFHVIHQENCGVSAARNRGLEWALFHSDSSWIAFIDSDDWIHPDYLKYLYEACISSHVNIAICGYSSVTSQAQYQAIINPSVEKKAVSRLYSIGSGAPNLVSLCARLFLKDQWRDVRFPVGRISEDRATTYKILFQNEDIAVLQCVMYYYFYNPESLVHKQWTPNRLDDLISIHEQMVYFEEHNLPDAWKWAAVSQLFCLRTSLDDLRKIPTKFHYYRFKLSVELYTSIFRYRRQKFLYVKNNEWIYEKICPNFMWLYWHWNALKNKLGL